MPRVHAVAYDIRAESPAQPRVAAWLRGCLGAGMSVVLYTERPPGAWVDDLAATGRLKVLVIADPIRRVYERLYARAQITRREPGPGVAPRPREGSLWRLGRGLQGRILFPDPQTIWSRRIGRAIRRRMAPGDLVLTCSRPESVGTIGEAAQRRGAVWWFDFADGWCFQGLRPEAMAPGPRRERERSLEARQVGSADVVSTVDPILAEAFARLRRDGDVVVYPNLIPDELLLPVDRPIRGRSRLCLAHFGRLSLSDPKRSLRPLLAVLESAPPIDFRFFGDFNDADRAELEALAALGHGVIAAPPLARAEIASRRDEFDGTLMVASPEQRGSSSKLLDSLGLALPVFAVVPDPSIAAHIVRDCRAGEVLAFERLAEGRSCWLRYCEGLRVGRYRVDPDARDRYTSGAFVPALVDRMVELMSRVGSRS
ncbi:MAG: hypothetical protein AB7I19_16720 [Planctomycetota bacterium]